MNGLFQRLAHRAHGVAPVLTPRVPSRFEPEDWTAEPADDDVTTSFDAPEARVTTTTRSPRVASSARPPARDSAAAATRPPPDAATSGSRPAVGARDLSVPTGDAAAASSASGGPASERPAPPGSAAAAAPPPAPSSTRQVPRAPTSPASPAAHGAAATPAREATQQPVVVPRAPGASRTSTALPVRVARRATAPAPSAAAAPIAAPPIAAPGVAAGVASHRSIAPAGNAADDDGAPREPTSPAAAVEGHPTSSHAPNDPAPPPAAPPVEITIGRVEIRFAPPVAAPTAPARQVGPPPLDELLARRHER